VCGVVLLIFGALFLLTLTAYYRYSTTVPSALDAAITRIWVLFHLRSLKSPKFSCLGFQNFHNFFQKTNFNSFVIQVSLTKSSPLKLRPCGAIQYVYCYYYCFFDPGTQFQGMKKIALCNTKKYKKSSWNEPYSSPSLNNCVGEGHSSFLLLLLLLLFLSPPAQSRRQEN